MTSVDHIRYDLLAQEALRGVVRRVLADAARDGMPGEHHFYISFDTRAPGVRLSQRMREKYPEEMTVVLQHQFWDLTANDNAFEVGLSFGGIPERLHIPYSAIKGFFDPSVKFGLQFELADTEAGETEDADDASGEDGAKPTPFPAGEPTPLRGLRGAGSEPAVSSSQGNGAQGTGAQGSEPPAEATDDERPSGGAEVVRLDVFRKK